MRCCHSPTRPVGVSAKTQSLLREDLDLDGGFAFVEASRTKGKRDAKFELHPILIKQLKAIVGFEPLVFDWPNHTRTLYAHFAKLKKAAEVDFGGVFHRLRFGFANANADRVPEDVLQQLMRHRARQTTRRYVNIAERMRRQRTADMLHVPDVLVKKA